jgi:L-amino acid N-acyltransferase YncA
MRIREATESDLSSIVKLYNDSISGGVASTNTNPVSLERSMGWFRQHRSSGKPLWVAEDDGKVVGWLSIRPFFRRPAYDATAKVMVYVDPGSRGKGVGTKLMRNAITCGQSAGLETFVCYLLQENQPAKEFLEASGFKKWGQFPGVARLAGIKRDLVVMGRQL